MSKINRREFSQLALAGAGAALLPASELVARVAAPALPPMINSTFRGVTIGAQSYSFRTLPLDAAIQGFASVGIGLCELWSSHLQQRGPGGRGRPGGGRRGRGQGAPNPEEMQRRRAARRERQRQWRETVSLDEIEAVGKKFHDAGVEIYAFNYSFRDDFSEAEIERGFEMAKVLGAKVITASSNVTTARRIDPFARKHKIRVGMHNHSRIEENEFATPADFEKARQGMSEYIAINLDIGHFTAANFDAVDYIDKHHDDIVTLHIKDRKKDQGENLPFGQGDTPIKEVLALLRDKQYEIPANIEYEYRGEDAVVEVKKCFEYCKNALLA